MENQLLLAYYGDDFTGSTDALEFLSRAGAKTALFMTPPSAATLAKYQGLKAIGVAGMSRAMSPDSMEKYLTLDFEALKHLPVRHIHYKVCSTFDSSPTIGSIGKAIEIGLTVFQTAFVPVLVAAPSLGRFCTFGNLFARMGIGSQGAIYRLDRHPSMSKHPITPADEGDLRLHLAKQTAKKIGLLDILQIVKPFDQVQKALQELVENKTDIVLIDGLYQEQFPQIGQLLDAQVNDSALFSVGSSGIEMALGGFWNAQQQLVPQETWEEVEEVSNLLVISGSCSPVSNAQIDWAKNNGYSEVILDAQRLCKQEITLATLTPYIEAGTALIQAGKPLVIHTDGGNANQNNRHFESLSSEKLGTALGLIAKHIIEKTGIKRLLIAGGDTSSFAARALEIEAIEMIKPLVPGAPLCRVCSPNPVIQGLEVNVKGGQVGAENYFGVVALGKS